MKKLLFAFAVAATVIPACNKVSEEVVPASQKTSITVGIGDPATKTQLNGTVELLWSAGDAILVQDNTYAYKTFTLEGAGGTATGTFSINEEVTIMSGDDGAQSFYPETLSPAYIAPSTHVTLPDTYTWSEAGVKAPMYAWLNKTTPWDYFKMLTSVIKVDIYNIPATASKLVFTSKGEVVSGDYVFPYDCIPVVPGDSNKSITITFTAGEKANRTFFIPVPYGSYTAGATFELKNSSDVQLAKKSAPAFTVAKESISYFPAINLGASVITTIWDGPIDCTAWGNWNDKWGLDLSSLKAGDCIRYNVTLDGGESYWQMRPQFYTSDWNALVGLFKLYDGQTCLDIPLTAEFAAAMNTSGGMSVQGINVTVSSVQIVPQQSEMILWTGSHSLGNWDNTLIAAGLNSAGMWASLTAGKTLSVYFKDSDSRVGDYGQFQIKKASDYSGISGLTMGLAEESNQSVRRFTLTAGQVTAIKESGILIQGIDLDITKITLR